MKMGTIRNVGTLGARGGALAVGLWAAAAANAPAPAAACGGFFCSASNPVNQAAEQIIFADNADGTVTAVIQILYEGPSEKFAWVLPVPGTPDIGVSSELALNTLKQATNPLYQLQTVFPDNCGSAFGNAGGFPTGTSAPAADAGSDPSVSVQASGAIGPYDYVVISLDPMLTDPAQVAIDWLTTEGYDVGATAPEVLRPYLEEGLNLLAFRLTKGNSAGSIRPVMLTYDSDLPSIPIRPTAVAANEDMGVLVWLLAGSRGIPENYKALELNEALIDWFNPNNNYNEVVSRAADDAMGQGFVTEYADTVQNLKNLGVEIFPSWQQEMWQSFQATVYTDPFQMISDAQAYWQGWDGFDEALTAAVTLPQGTDPEDFKNCLRCFQNDPAFAFDTSVFLLELYKQVIKPMIDTQALLDSRPYLTRLYTTMSADEMDTDPVFAFNPDLPAVSNRHFADRVIDCVNGIADPSNGPWRVELEQGDVVRGSQVGVWPIGIDDAPAALKIMQYGTSGPGEVLEDRSNAIRDLLDEYNASLAPSTGSGGSGEEPPPASMCAGRASGASCSSAMDPSSGLEPDSNATVSESDGCSVATTRGDRALGLLAWAFFALALGRRRRA